MNYSNQLTKLSSQLEGLRHTNPQPKSDYIVIMMHGYGANAFDLFPFANYFANLGLKEWIFPQAPLSIPGMPTGRAWYPIDMVALEKALASGEFRNFEDPLPQEADHSCKKIHRLIEELDHPPEKIILGGFSQGAILSTKTLIDFKVPLAGLIVLSGIIIDSKNWIQKINDLDSSKLKYFQSHGRHDPVLPFEGAKKLNEAFCSSQWAGEFVEFSGQHEIPQDVLNRMGNSIQSMLQ